MAAATTSMDSVLQRSGRLLLAAALLMLSMIPACAEDNIPKTASNGSTFTESSGVSIPKPPIDEKHPLYLPLQEAYKAREVLKGVKEYDAVFMKRELIGRKLQKTTMNLKLRQQPFSVYLKFLDASAGREVIYVQGRDNNNLLVHEASGLGSLAGTLQLQPTSATAMQGNRYPVTMIGMQIMVDKVIAQWEAEGKFGEVQTQKYPEASLPSLNGDGKGEPCIAYESLHPTQRDQFKFHTTRLWISKQTNLPVRVEQLGFPQRHDKTPPVVEEYTYSNVKTDVKLTDVDFDRRNPAYAFP